MSAPTNDSWPHGPCVVCGKDGGQEPRFLYFVCKEHEGTPPAQQWVLPPAPKPLPILRGETAGGHRGDILLARYLLGKEMP